jgi:thiol-disulfide isomerase/thioredoxin
MKSTKLLACSLLLAAATSFAAAEPPAYTPYRTGDWKALVKAHAGTPFIVHFWGVTCAPCIVELPRWGEFARRHPELPVVFVEVDPATAPAVGRYVTQARLDAAAQRQLVTPFDEYMRFEVDPRWAGELPATMLVGRDGKATRLSGEVDFRRLDKWWMSQRRTK